MKTNQTIRSTDIMLRYWKKWGIYKVRPSGEYMAMPPKDHQSLFVYFVTFVSLQQAVRLRPMNYTCQSTLHCISLLQPARSQAVLVVVDPAVHPQQGNHPVQQAGCFSYALGACFRRVAVAMLALVGFAAVLAHRKYSADDLAVGALQSLLRGKVGRWRTAHTKAEQWDLQKGWPRCG